MNAMPVASWGIADLCLFLFMNLFAMLKTHVGSITKSFGNSYLFRFVHPPTCCRIFVDKSIFRQRGDSPRGGCRA